MAELKYTGIRPMCFRRRGCYGYRHMSGFTGATNIEATGSPSFVTIGARVPPQAPQDGGGRAPWAEKDLRGLRLIGEDLSGLDLSGFDLSGADLSRANLVGARLVGAKLQDAVLFEADLTDTEFFTANLAGANLSACRAERAGLESVDLTNATLFDARLRGASLSGARLAGADLRAASLVGARLRETDLARADLTRTILREADLEGSDVTDATFVDADLRQAHLRGLRGFARANWVGTDVFGVNFSGAYMLRRTIADQNYLHEFRTKSTFNSALYWVWWATSDCGRSFLRWGSWIAFLALLFAGLYEFVALDYGEHRTPFSSLYYSVVTLTTLGYGDIVPASPGAQILAMVEVVLGYVMLGGLLSIFANKMARRAD